MNPSEVDLRRRLGVPVEAGQVMVVTESTHWDPDWLFTSDQYFRFRVRRSLDRAIDALLQEPRRVFSLECTFFPNLYWESRPQQRACFRALVNAGRLRFTGSGVTTPDTLIPEDESLLRDLLIGQEWLRSRGMTQEPRVLYLPDSFGHSPGTPALLAAAGVPYAAVSRIDGMRFVGADWESAANFPRPGTSAALLMAERTADFVWRGPDGSEVLAHWHAHGYGHGDLIASGGISRALALPTAWPNRRERHVARRIENYIEDLSQLARTPYLLLALGSDFVDPVPRLLELLDRWNEDGYQRTGVWLVNAGLDDYFDLVGHHRDRLPTLALDPNPYWMGFYATRPALKRACKDLGRRLVAYDNERARAALAGAAPLSQTMLDSSLKKERAPFESLPMSRHRLEAGATGGTGFQPVGFIGPPDQSAAAGRGLRVSGRKSVESGRGSAHAEALEAWGGVSQQAVQTDAAHADAWWTAATSNHHDFVTGTTPDRVTYGEHWPWLRAALAGPAAGLWPEQYGSWARDGPLAWTRNGALVTVTTAWLTAVFDEERGGALVSLTDASGIEQLAAPSLELKSYAESGGLWRMGHEFRGGRWVIGDRSTRHSARITVTATDDVVRLTIRGRLDDRPTQIAAAFTAHDPAVLVRTAVTAPDKRTVTLASHQRSGIASLVMHQPGGVVTRPLQRWYQPTFWPLHSFATAMPDSSGGASPAGLALAAAVPTAIHATAAGSVEIVVARTATKEFAFGVVPIGAPASGHERATQVADVALRWLDRPDQATVIKVGRELAVHVDRAAGRRQPAWLVETDDPLLEVIAVKPADRGDGIVVRLRNWGAGGPPRATTLRLAAGLGAEICVAWRTDSNERDLEVLPVSGGAVRLEIGYYLTTVRLSVKPAGTA